MTAPIVYAKDDWLTQSDLSTLPGIGESYYPSGSLEMSLMFPNYVMAGNTVLATAD